MVTKTLGEVLLCPPMYGLNAAACDYLSGASKYIRITDISDNGEYCPTDSAYVLSDDERFCLRENDIVLARTGASVGKSYLYNNKDGKLIFAGFLIKISVDPQKADARFVFECLHTKHYWDWIRSESTRSGQPGVNGKQYASFELQFPPLPEQRLIAAALSDTDAYIAALEKLIAKKRLIKQGAMQELLTGKRRLPGFRGEWVEKSIGELFDISGGLSASRAQLLDIGYPYLHYGDIHGSYKTFVDVCLEDNIPCLDIPLSRVSKASLLQDGDVVFVDASEDDEGASRHIVIRNVDDIPFISGLHTIVAKAIDSMLCNRYREFCFQTAAVKAQFRFYAVGTKVVGVSKTSIKEITLYFPIDRNEQTAIAEVLSDMDAEVDALTAKLEKVRQIKQGMMSELLTGRIRLIERKPMLRVLPKPAAEPTAVASVKADHGRGHNQQFDDAVMIAGIVSIWGANPTYPLGRKKTQKLLYLLRRHQGASIEQFQKKAAGPYADTVRYKGGERIAISRKYIVEKKSMAGSSFCIGDEVSEAHSYLQQWGARADFAWLKKQFHFTRVDDLELLATVDMAISDLKQANTPVTVESIKNLIATVKEWKAKLKKQTFSDENIARAIQWSCDLFGGVSYAEN